jgi:hypothetical protein
VGDIDLRIGGSKKVICLINDILNMQSLQYQRTFCFRLCLCDQRVASLKNQ